MKTSSSKSGATSRSGIKTAKAAISHKAHPSIKSSNEVFFNVFRLAPNDFIREVRRGTRAKEIGVVARALGVPDTRYVDMLGLSRSTFNRKMKDDEVLDRNLSERHMRVMRMVGQLSGLISEFGDPKGFDAAQWFGAWIEQPNQALGNAKPSEYLDTAMGAEVVEATLQRMFTGAYS